MILSIGSPTYMAVAAAEKATAAGVPTDVIVINGFPLADDFFDGIRSRYTRVLTLEDGLIGISRSVQRLILDALR